MSCWGEHLSFVLVASSARTTTQRCFVKETIKNHTLHDKVTTIVFASLCQHKNLEQTLQCRVRTALFIILQKAVQGFSPVSNLLLEDFNALCYLPLRHSVLLYSMRSTRELSESPPFAYMTITRAAQNTGIIK